MVVEVEVLPDGTVLVPAATVALDAGFVANPELSKPREAGGHGEASLIVVAGVCQHGPAAGGVDELDRLGEVRLGDDHTCLHVLPVPGVGLAVIAAVGHQQVYPAGNLIQLLARELHALVALVEQSH